MKKRQQRIALERETVRCLDPGQLDAAKGGINYSTGDICHTKGYTCPMARG
jgi:hypothetical protein